MHELNRRTLLRQAAAWSLAPLCGSVATSAARLAAAEGEGPFQAGEPPKPADGSFTIAVLPDTQNYSEFFPETYLAQTKWLVDRQKERNIASVLHLGDITNHNTVPEWRNAVAAMNQLDGVIPYFIAVGNHDYSEGGHCGDRTTRFNDYFPLDKFHKLPTFGGVYDKEPDRLENSFHLFSAGGRDFLVISLEFGPRADVIRWANDVAAQHRQREAILITHAYMFYDDTRYDWAAKNNKQPWNPHEYGVAATTGDDVNDGQQLWDKLVAPRENFILTVNGHVLDDGLGRLVTATPGGRNVPQLLVNFQMKPNGGDGWLRLLEFQPDRRTVEVYDYSPTLNQLNVSPQNRFAIKTDPVAVA